MERFGILGWLFYRIFQTGMISRIARNSNRSIPGREQGSQIQLFAMLGVTTNSNSKHSKVHIVTVYPVTITTLLCIELQQMVVSDLF